MSSKTYICAAYRHTHIHPVTYVHNTDTDGDEGSNYIYVNTPDVHVCVYMCACIHTCVYINVIHLTKHIYITEPCIIEHNI